MGARWTFYLCVWYHWGLCDSWPFQLPDFSSSFQKYEQEDAHEFLQCFLDKLESCCNDLMQNVTTSGNNIVKKVFGGRLVSSVRTGYFFCIFLHSIYQILILYNYFFSTWLEINWILNCSSNAAAVVIAQTHMSLQLTSAWRLIMQIPFILPWIHLQKLKTLKIQRQNLHVKNVKNKYLLKNSSCWIKPLQWLHFTWRDSKTMGL